MSNKYSTTDHVAMAITRIVGYMRDCRAAFVDLNLYWIKGHCCLF